MEESVNEIKIDETGMRINITSIPLRIRGGTGDDSIDGSRYSVEDEDEDLYFQASDDDNGDGDNVDETEKSTGSDPSEIGTKFLAMSFAE